MTKVTISIPIELKAKLDKHPHVNWTEVLRSGIKEKISKLKRFEDMEGKI
jgi:hypothetical protein